jgi:hypothetical protein
LSRSPVFRQWRVAGIVPYPRHCDSARLGATGVEYEALVNGARRCDARRSFRARRWEMLSAGTRLRWRSSHWRWGLRNSQSAVVVTSRFPFWLPCLFPFGPVCPPSADCYNMGVKWLRAKLRNCLNVISPRTTFHNPAHSSKEYFRSTRPSQRNKGLPQPVVRKRR